MYISLLFLFIVKCICISNKYEKLKKHSLSKGAFISDMISLNISYNKYHFISNTNISSNTTLLSIPSSLFINVNNSFPFISKSYKQLYHNLSSIFLPKNNTSFHIHSSEEITNPQLRVNEIFLAFLQSITIPYHKGKLYKKYKHYFNLYSQSNLDNFPIYYTTEQLMLLVNTSLGSQIQLSKSSLEDEAISIKNLLSDISLFNYEEYYKYRVLSISKASYFNNDVHLIPFIDMFNTHPVHYSVTYEYDNVTQMLNVITKKDIMKGSDIVMEGYYLSNLYSLMFYGKTYEEGNYVDKYLVPLVHPEWIIESKYEDDDIINEMIDLGKEDFYKEGIEKYRTLCKMIGIEETDANAYSLMKNNLNMFWNDYLYVEEYMYEKVFFSKEDAMNVKRVINVEKRLLKERIEFINNILLNLQTNHNEDL